MARQKHRLTKLIRKRITYMKRRHLPGRERAPVWQAAMEARVGRLQYRNNRDTYATKIQGMARKRAYSLKMQGKKGLGQAKTKGQRIADRALFRAGIPRGVRQNINSFVGRRPGRGNIGRAAYGTPGYIAMPISGGLCAIRTYRNNAMVGASDGARELYPSHNRRFPTNVRGVRGTPPNRRLAARIRGNINTYTTREAAALARSRGFS